MIREGSGSEIIAAIKESPRALVFISVPWSVPERQARQAYYEAVAQLQFDLPEVDFFRLEVDEDAASDQWLTSIGRPQFVGLGAGSLIWLVKGKVIASQSSGCSLGRKGMISQSLSLWAEALGRS